MFLLVVYLRRFIYFLYSVRMYSTVYPLLHFISAKLYRFLLCYINKEFISSFTTYWATMAYCVTIIFLDRNCRIFRHIRDCYEFPNKDMNCFRAVRQWKFYWNWFIILENKRWELILTDIKESCATLAMACIENGHFH